MLPLAYFVRQLLHRWLRQPAQKPDLPSLADGVCRLHRD